MEIVTEQPIIARDPLLDSDRVVVPLTLENGGIKTINQDDEVDPKLLRGFPNVNKYSYYGWMRWTGNNQPQSVP